MTAELLIPEMTAAQRDTLLDVAEEAIRSRLLGRPMALPSTALDADDPLAQVGASFVTLRRDGRLLGCIGSIESERPLIDDVAANAQAAAFRDPRLPAVTPNDFEQMEIKVSVLSPMRRLEAASYDDLVAAVQPGVDGLLIGAPGHRGTFLPSVWDQLPDREDFLDALWQKAGLRPRTWPRALVVERYHTVEFGRPGPRRLA